MRVPEKAILVIAVLGALTIGALWLQRSASAPKSIKLSAQDMELLMDELPAAQLKDIQSNPDEKKQLVQNLKQMLAVGQAAEMAGYAEKPTIKAEIAFQTDLVLNNAYAKKNPGSRASKDEIDAYNQGNPTDFDSFLQSRPQETQQRAQGPQREQLKRAFGELRVIATKARQDKLDKTRETQIEIMINKYNILGSEYEKDLQSSDKLVADGDIQKYYDDHPDEFEEVKARHILISTGPKQPDDADADAKDNDKDKDKKDQKPKPLTKEEAQKKAEMVLDLVHKGGDFAKLAEQYSDDGSKTSGGDLGYFAKGKMVPEFEKAAFALKPGEVSGIVESQFGFHIIKVEDHRTEAVTDPKVREQIIAKLKDEKVKERIDDITSKSKVQIAEDFNIPNKPDAPPQGAPQLPAGPPKQN